MSKLICFKLDQLGDPHVGAPLPDRVLEGNQIFRTWDVNRTDDGQVEAGVWEATSGAFRAIMGARWELCMILSGATEITEADKEPVVVRTGDCFVMEAGFVGTWRVLETTRKIWVTKDGSSTA